MLPSKENTLVRIIEKEIQGLASGLYGISILGSDGVLFQIPFCNPLWLIYTNREGRDQGE